MELRHIIALQEAWQQTVREYGAFMRDVRGQKLSPEEIHKRSRIHRFRIDATFAKLKAAEQFGRLHS
jgi:hypothetical protein